MNLYIYIYIYAFAHIHIYIYKSILRGPHENRYSLVHSKNYYLTWSVERQTCVIYSYIYIWGAVKIRCFCWRSKSIMFLFKCMTTIKKIVSRFVLDTLSWNCLMNPLKRTELGFKHFFFNYRQCNLFEKKNDC